MLVLNAKLSSI